MDDVSNSLENIIIGTVNTPDSIDPALRRMGRFEQEIHFGLPDQIGRLEIFRIHTIDMKLADDVDLEQVRCPWLYLETLSPPSSQIAVDTPDYVGSDFSHLCSEVSTQAVRAINIPQDVLEAEELQTILVTMEHFRSALSTNNLSALREFTPKEPAVVWEHIGGLDDVKKELQETIQHPCDYPMKKRGVRHVAVQWYLVIWPSGHWQDFACQAHR
jgi:transitional endoplasmic reticulum ATPase